MSDSVTIVIAVAVVALFFKYVILGSDSSQPTNQPNRTTSRNRTQGRHPVSQEGVSTIVSMFPDFSRRQIELEYSNVGNVEAICDKILAGELMPITPPSAASSSILPNVVPEYIQSKEIIAKEPEKSYKDEKSARSEHLKQRKQWMIQQARKKFLEKEKQIKQ